MAGDQCYFCDEFRVLEEHHIVPRRHGGLDNAENIVTVCPTCHQKLERLYDTRFFKKIGVGSGYTSEPDDNQEELTDADKTNDYYIPEQVQWFFEVFNNLVLDRGRDVSHICSTVRSGGAYFRFHLKSVWRMAAPFKDDTEYDISHRPPESINELRDHFRRLQKESKLVDETSIATRVEGGERLRCVGLDYELVIEKTPLQITKWKIDHSRALEHPDVQVQTTEGAADD